MLGESWQPTGSLAEQRVYHSATVLQSNKVLVVGGWSYNSYLATATLYDVASGSWSTTGSLSTPRQAHTATLLPSGQVLVVGGENFSGYTASAELYAPASGTWSSASSMALGRGYATATLLQSGKVLVAGGLTPGGAQTAVDIYEPSTSTWSSAAPMRAHRRSHTATRLPSGKVLVVGGWGGEATATAELYDPATGSWSFTASMSTPRFDHTATLLPSGKVLVTGGQNASGAVSTAELYNPATGTWSSTGSMATPRYAHTATLLPSGLVLAAGGIAATARQDAELFNEANGTWSPTAAMSAPRAFHISVLSPAINKVLVAGGWAGSPLATAELYQPPASIADCRQIHLANPSLPSGVYQIDPDGVGGSPSFQAYCDMTTDGGGWTLVLSYRHPANGNAPLVPGVFPLNTTTDYAHATAAQIHGLNPTDLRFYCETSLHPRKIHFKTSQADVLAYMRGTNANNSPSFWASGFSVLAGHTAYLPAATTHTYAVADPSRLTYFPFWRWGTYHWGIQGGGSRWECDDQANGPGPSTFHQVWAR